MNRRLNVIELDFIRILKEICTDHPNSKLEPMACVNYYNYNDEKMELLFTSYESPEQSSHDFHGSHKKGNAIYSLGAWIKTPSIEKGRPSLKNELVLNVSKACQTPIELDVYRKGDWEEYLTKKIFSNIESAKKEEEESRFSNCSKELNAIFK